MLNQPWPTRTTFTFPVGYHNFHRDRHINYQLNRWTSLGYWTEEDAAQIGAQIENLHDWKPLLVTTAVQMEADGRCLAAAFAYRAAEFFTTPHDPDKMPLYLQFHKAFYAAVDPGDFERHAIPYQDGELPALRFRPENSRGTWVIHGGLDSFMEEFYTVALYLVAHGYDVILFEGPGQGAALRHSGLAMTHEWEHAVTALLDYFQLSEVTLVGVSLGGYLALRAAAFEPRIARVVAFDVFIYDQHGTGLQRQVYRLFVRFPRLYNLVARTAMRFSPAAEHLICQWMFVTHSRTPAEWNARIEHYSVSDIAAQVRQDVLLLAGEDDHLIPRPEYDRNRAGLTQARSVTGRVFTAAEQAQNHCQVGNLKLALDTMVEWVRELS